MALYLDVWSDVVCPWCYIGKRRLEAALADFPHRDEVHVRWHAFELDPGAPKQLDPSKSHAERLAAKYRTSVAQAEQMIERVRTTAAADGLEMRFDRAKSGNTFDAHRVIRLAGSKDAATQGAVTERLFRGYFTDGEAIGEGETLARLAAEAGLDAEETRAMLAGDALSREVREDEETARDLGIHGVPFYVIGEKYGLSGAQPPAVLRGAMEKAWG